jgi:hypothetical protein
VQAQAFTAKVAEPQLIVFYIKDAKMTLIDIVNLDLKTCIISVIKNEHLKRSL